MAANSWPGCWPHSVPTYHIECYFSVAQPPKWDCSEARKPAWESRGLLPIIGA